MSAARELLIKIKSLFDRSGTDAAAGGVENLGKKSEEAASRSKTGFLKAGQGATMFGKTMSNVNKLMTGFGILGVISALMALWQTLKKVYEWIDGKLNAAVRKAAEEARKAMDAFADRRLGDMRKKVADSAAEFDRLSKAIAGAESRAKALSAAGQAFADARKERDMLMLDAREKAETAALAPGDAAGAAEISARYSTRRSEVEARHAADRDARAVIAAESAVTAADATRQSSFDAIDRNQQTRREAGASLSAANMRLENAKANSDTPSIERESKAIAELNKNLEALAKEDERLREAIREAAGKRELAALDLDTARFRAGQVGTAREAVRAQDVAGYERAAAEARISARRSELLERARPAASAASARADAFRAEADAFSPQRGDFRRQDDFNAARNKDKRLENAAAGAEKMNAEAQRLLDQLEKTPPEKLAGLLSKITAQLSGLERAIADAESRSRRQ